MAEKDLTGIYDLKALLGPGSEFEGKLIFEGSIRIEGRFTGEIFGEGALVVAEPAEVCAEIAVGTLIVRGGSVRGNITATRLVEIYASARVHGDICAPQLFLDKGAVFEGSCVMPDEGGKTGEPADDRGDRP